MKRLFLLTLLTAGIMSAASASDTLTVRIKGMRCEECAYNVTNALSQEKGIGGIVFNLERRTASIAFDPAQTCSDSIKARLAATRRYRATPYDPTEVIRRGMGQRIDDMHCRKCYDRIAQRLGNMVGIDSLAPHLDKHYIFIRYDANRTCRDSIRAVINSLGYTPVNYYTSPNVAFAYYLLPAGQATRETLEMVQEMDGVEDVNVNPRRNSLAVTYFSDETSADQLLQNLRLAGISAELPKPHECREEQ